VFDLSITKILVLAVLAIVIFGPDQLPKIASQAGRTLREIRRMAQGATDELKENLGPEFADFDVTDLHPKNFVRKHLMDGFDDFTEEPQVPDLSMADAGAGLPGLAPGEDPPYDTEAT
jgi:sec-independent protein translocase protein TatB